MALAPPPGPAAALLRFRRPVQPEPSPPPPAILSTAIDANPFTTLAASVLVRTERVDSVRVQYRADDDPVRTSPFVRIQADSARIAVLGLLPETPYRLVVEATGSSTTVRSDTLSHTTGGLPERLEQVTIRTTGRSTHPYTLVNGANLGTPALVYAFDSEGRIRWYREFTEYPEAPNPAKETKQQANGNITVFVGESSGYEPLRGRYVEIRPTGEIVGTYQAPGDFYTDGHELLLTFDQGSLHRIHLFSYDHRTTDLRSMGGPADVMLSGHRIHRLLPDGSIEFEWNSWEHLRVEDWIEPPASAKNQPVADFDHPNSIDLDEDGNYVVSWRHLGEVSKIDGETGEFLWRFGGVHNQFEIVGDPFGKFSAQHMARILDNGNLLLFDNGLRHDPMESRAVEYRLDTSAMTATMVWQYRSQPPILSFFVSGAERHRSGNTLVGFGVPGHMAEVAPDGTVVWTADLEYQGRSAIFYRAHAIPTLYGYERP